MKKRVIATAVALSVALVLAGAYTGQISPSLTFTFASNPSFSPQIGHLAIVASPLHI